jgi:hypothetical protein
MDAMKPLRDIEKHEHAFEGKVFLFQCFDVGDDINFTLVKNQQLIPTHALVPPKYFKNYHIPLSVELPQPEISTTCTSAQVHSFGALSLSYTVPFKNTLEELRSNITAIYDNCYSQSVKDASAIYHRLYPAIKQPRFFQLRTTYMLIQVNQEPDHLDPVNLKDEYGSVIASMLRFETESLSEHKKNEILAPATGYYRGDLIIVDTQAAFVYDDEYEDILPIFEFANMQQLELQYFDRVLDEQLNVIYNRQVKTLPFKAYLPFIGALINNPVDDLGKLRVDISVITERLENSIKLAGEAYFAELYDLLVGNLGIKSWKDSIEHKLSIIRDIGTVYQNKVDAIREDLLSVSILFFFFIEVAIGILSFFAR